jgi:hypothetical protein
MQIFVDKCLLHIKQLKYDLLRKQNNVYKNVSGIYFLFFFQWYSQFKNKSQFLNQWNWNHIVKRPCLDSFPRWIYHSVPFIPKEQTLMGLADFLCDFDVRTRQTQSQNTLHSGKQYIPCLGLVKVLLIILAASVFTQLLCNSCTYQH